MQVKELEVQLKALLLAVPLSVERAEQIAGAVERFKREHPRLYMRVHGKLARELSKQF